MSYFFFVLPMWHFHDFLPLWHHFSTPCDTKNNCLTPCDIHFHRHFYGGDDQFIFCTPVTSYFGLSVLLWHDFFNPCDRGHNLLILDPCDHFTRYWPLWQSIFACFYPCDKYVVTSPPARLLNGKAKYMFEYFTSVQRGNFCRVHTFLSFRLVHLWSSLNIFKR